MPVNIYKNKLLRARGVQDVFEIECSKGTISLIAHDLGKSLGCGAHLCSLRRTKVGKFSERDMVSLDVLSRSESWDSFLSPIGSALSQLPSRLSLKLMTVEAVEWPASVLEKKEKHGLGLFESSNESHKRFIGVGEVKENRVLRPMRMISVSR